MKSYPLESLNYFLNTSLLGHLSQARPPWLLHNSGPCPPFLQSRLMLMLLWTLVVLPLHLSPETREIVFACSKRVNTIFPLQAEAEAIKWSLTLTANLEFEAIIIESDSQVSFVGCPSCAIWLHSPTKWSLACNFFGSCLPV